MRSALPRLAALAALLAPLAVAASPPPPLSTREVNELKQQVGAAANAGEWGKVEELVGRLAEANKREVWTFMVKVTESAPERSTELPLVLRNAAAHMDDRQVQQEVRRTVQRSRSVLLRRQLILFLAERQDWPTLIEALENDDEATAATAAWRLCDARVEAAVEPMLARMERLDRTHDGIWDVLRNVLGRLLGVRCESAIEYRSRWLIVQERGGLGSVQPEPQPQRDPGALTSMTANLFGRQIECTRVVFILDVSGSMTAIDPGQQPPPPAPGTTTRPGDGQAPDGQPVGRTRMDRAKEELTRVIHALPANVHINIVAYSSMVAIWRGEGEGGEPAHLHALTAENRTSAAEFVGRFRADGVTKTDDALARAFSIEGARCFYLLSDGFATHDGTTRVPTADVLRLIDEYGRDRHITIHTLGFVGADREMMQAVATHTGGQYSDIR